MAKVENEKKSKDGEFVLKTVIEGDLGFESREKGELYAPFIPWRKQPYAHFVLPPDAFVGKFYYKKMFTSLHKMHKLMT